MGCTPQVHSLARGFPVVAIGIGTLRMLNAIRILGLQKMTRSYKAEHQRFKPPHCDHQLTKKSLRTWYLRRIETHRKVSAR